jgi:phosphohistidine swiveling domain-containing protein
MGRPHAVLALAAPGALEPDSAGAKAANIARAARAGFPTVPGFVITTAGAADLGRPEIVDELRDAYDSVMSNGDGRLVVRSSSTIEDIGDSSMAGRFTSVLDVSGWEELLAAVHTVLASADRVPDASGTPRPMAVLVQVQIDAAVGGVMFGVDPVTGRRDHVVVEAVPGRPDTLVGGTALADHYVLSRRGRIVSAQRSGGVPGLGIGLRIALARLARRAGHEFGAPQDIEWCVDRRQHLWLLQSRPVTAIPTDDPAGSSVLLGPGPLAETFPAPLGPLEQDLWLEPLRDGVVRALRTTGAASRPALERSPVVTAVDGWAVVDLDLFGLTDGHTSLRRRINPAVILRRLGTAWRVGRLRVALPSLAESVVATVDRDLAAIPRLDALGDDELADVLGRARVELASVHAHEVLAGILLDDDGRPTAAAAALHALHDGRSAGWDDRRLIERSAVVLALVPPRLDGPSPLPAQVAGPRDDPISIDDLAPREALRLRARWLQELTACISREIGRRLVDAGELSDLSVLGRLRLAELTAMATGGPPPAGVDGRVNGHPAAPPLPPAFRMSARGAIRVPARASSRRPGSDLAGQPAGGGRVVGVVRHDAPTDLTVDASGDPIILVTRHLEPQLATALGALGGLVSETGSPLSHLAILAREIGLPTVVAVPGALDRFPPGATLLVDGTTGEVQVVADGDPRRSGPSAERVTEEVAT